MQSIQRWLIAGSVMSLVLNAAMGKADVYTFTNSVSSPSYNTVGNWDLGSVPGASDNARFTNNASYTVGFSANAQNAKATFDAVGGNVTLGIASSVWALSDSLAVGTSNGVTPSVTLSTGTLTVTNNGAGLLDIGTGGAGSFTIQGAAATSVVDRIQVTNVVNGVGNSFLHLRNGVLTSWAGSSIFMSTNGSSTAGPYYGDFRVGPTNGSSVTMIWNIQGGTHFVNVPSVGGEFNPAFMIGGNALGLRGVVNVSGAGTVLSNYGGGRILIGAAHNWGSNFGNGDSGNNQMNITDGAAVYQSGFTLIGWSGRDNKLLVTGSNSLFSSSGGVALGKSGGGNSIIVREGARLVGNTVSMGEAGACDNSLILVTDANSLAVMNLYVSCNYSSVIVTNGATLRLGALVCGDANKIGSSNVLTVTGSGSVLTNTGNTALNVPNHTARGICRGLWFKVEKGGVAHMSDLYIGGYHNGFTGGSNSVQVSTVVSDPQSLLVARGKIVCSKHLWDTTVNLVVTNGASVISQNAEIGNYPFTPTAFLPMAGSALVTGSGSVWSNQSDVYMGVFTNATGYLDVRAGGRLVTARVRAGYHAFGTGTVMVADSGSALLATSTFYVGEVGQGRLTVTGGGSLVVTNTGATGLLDIRRGTFTVENNGSVTADKLTFTNTVDALTFVAGSSGLGSVKVKGALTLLAGSKLKIDLTSYTLAPGQKSEVLTLFEYGTLPTQFNLANVQIVNPKFIAKLSQGSGTSDKITLSVFRVGTMLMVN